MKSINKFNIDEKFIDKHLFTTDKQQKGPKTYLNTNYLPNFF